MRRLQGYDGLTKCALIHSNECVRFLFEKKENKNSAMADYRFSAQVIKRSEGKSSVASAAYRAGQRLEDERTGEIHDYGRKGGVIHSEVLAPEGTPDWMHDRAQLWNAVESVERRKDAQLAREVQLSLPHELDQEQRKALLLDFVQEQFVNQGMIADVAIHAPSQAGDERNHHAHVMLTMRELTGDGFGKKNRDWNSPEILANWREEWANHQNRALERGGHDARVSHLSYEAQGIDREPTQHLGAVASDMERKGKASRIGDENRQIANDNAAQVLQHIERSRLEEQIAREKRSFEGWADYKRDEQKNAQKLADLDLSQKHHRQNLRLEDELNERNGTTKKTIQAELDTIDRRLQAKGVRKILRTVFGQARSDKETQRDLKATLAGIEKRENEEREALRRHQEIELKKEARRQNKNRDGLQSGIEIARSRREKDGWKPRGPTRGTKRTGRPERAAKASQVQSSAPTPQNAPQSATERIKGEFAGKVAKPAEPSLADKKRHSSEKLDRLKGDLKRPWDSEFARSSSKEATRNPWASEYSRDESNDNAPANAPKKPTRDR